MEIITCPDVTRTSLAGGQLNCATLGISIAKVPSCSLSHEGSPSNCLAIWCNQTLSCEHPGLSACVDSFKLPGMSMSHATSQHSAAGSAGKELISRLHMHGKYLRLLTDSVR